MPALELVFSMLHGVEMLILTISVPYRPIQSKSRLYRYYYLQTFVKLQYLSEFCSRIKKPFRGDLLVFYFWLVVVTVRPKQIKYRQEKHYRAADLQCHRSRSKPCSSGRLNQQEYPQYSETEFTDSLSREPVIYPRLTWKTSNSGKLRMFTLTINLVRIKAT